MSAKIIKRNLVMALVASGMMMATALNAQASDDDHFGWKHHDNMHERMPGHGHMPGHPGHDDLMGHRPGHHDRHHGKPKGKHSGHGKREFKPRNAAVNFLRMRKMLNLNTDQVAALRKLRDGYITDYSVSEKQLAAARNDLIQMIYSGTSMETIDAKLSEIGRLEGSLWRGFVTQYKEITDNVLTERQRARVMKEAYVED